MLNSLDKMEKERLIEIAKNAYFSRSQSATKQVHDIETHMNNNFEQSLNDPEKQTLLTN